MGGFLGSIINTKDDLDLFNNHFFARYADYRIISELLRIKMRYLEVARLTEERYNPKFLKEVEANKKSLEQTEIIIDGYTRTLSDLEKEREELSKVIQELYQAGKYDDKKLETLEADIDLISTQKKELSQKLNKQLATKNSLLGQKKKYDSKINKLDNQLENLRSILQDNLPKVDINNLDIFEGFNYKNTPVLEKYFIGLGKEIENDHLALDYYKYFYKTVNEEIKALKDIVLCADKFAKTTDREKGYKVPELFERNRQFINLDLLFDHLHDNISKIILEFDDKEYGEYSDMVADAYKETEPFISNIIEYMNNYDKYSKDPMLESETHRKLVDEYYKIDAINDKLTSNIGKVIQRITGKKRSHIKSFAFEDLALHAFELYVDRSIYRKPNSVTKKNLNEPKNSSKFKPTESIKSDKEFKDFTKFHEITHMPVDKSIKDRPQTQEKTNPQDFHEYSHMLGEGVNKEHNQFIEKELSKINVDDLVDSIKRR